MSLRAVLDGNRAGKKVYIDSHSGSKCDPNYRRIVAHPPWANGVYSITVFEWGQQATIVLAMPIDHSNCIPTVQSAT